MQDRLCEQDEPDGEGGVFEIRDLGFHGTEFDAPAYGIVRGRGFEAHVLPV